MIEIVDNQSQKRQSFSVQLFQTKTKRRASQVRFDPFLSDIIRNAQENVRRKKQRQGMFYPLIVQVQDKNINDNVINEQTANFYEFSPEFIDQITAITSKPLILISVMLPQTKLKHFLSQILDKKTIQKQFNDLKRCLSKCNFVFSTVKLLSHLCSSNIIMLFYNATSENIQLLYKNAKYFPIQTNLYNLNKIFLHFPQMIILDMQNLKNSFRQFCQTRKENSLDQLLKFDQSLLLIDENSDMLDMYRNYKDVLQELFWSLQIVNLGIYRREQILQEQFQQELHVPLNQKKQQEFYSFQDQFKDMLFKCQVHNSNSVQMLANRYTLSILFRLLKQFFPQQSTILNALSTYLKDLSRQYDKIRDEIKLKIPMDQLKLFHLLQDVRNQFYRQLMKDSQLLISCSHFCSFHRKKQIQIEEYYGNTSALFTSSNTNNLDRTTTRDKQIKNSINSNNFYDAFMKRINDFKNYVLQQEKYTFEANESKCKLKNEEIITKLYQEIIEVHLKSGDYIINKNQQIMSSGIVEQNRNNFSKPILSYGQTLHGNSLKKPKLDTQLIQQDFLTFMSAYKEESFKINDQLTIFNNFMAEKKKSLNKQLSNQLKKEQDKLANLGEENKRDQVRDQVTMQKGILSTLERQVKHLQNTRKTIQDKNLQTKNEIDQLTRKYRQSKRKTQIQKQQSNQKMLGSLLPKQNHDQKKVLRFIESEKSQSMRLKIQKLDMDDSSVRMTDRINKNKNQKNMGKCCCLIM